MLLAYAAPEPPPVPGCMCGCGPAGGAVMQTVEGSTLDAPPAARRWLKHALLALAVLVPLAPVAIGAVLLSTAAPRTAPAAVLHPLSQARSPLVVRPPVTVVHAPPGTSTVAALRHPTSLRAAPGGPTLAPLPVRTEFGSPTVLLVRRRRPGWLGVVSPLAGNHRLGWIPAGSASLSRITWKLEVSLSQRRLTVVHRGRPVARYAVAIGAPGAPTPTGYFAVTDRLVTGDPSGPYGCCIIALSAKAPHAIQGWGGGNRIAIHSTPETWTIGQAVSHGCLRLTLAQGHWLIAHVPLGTPAIIRSE